MKSLAKNSVFKTLRSWHLVPSLHGRKVGERGKQWQILFSWIPKSLWTVIAAMKLKDTCSLEGKLMTNLERVLQSESITLPTKVHIVKDVAFPIVTYGCESWTVKKVERRRIDAFKLWH